MSGLGMSIQGKVSPLPPRLSMRSMVTARACPQMTAAATMSEPVQLAPDEVQHALAAPMSAFIWAAVMPLPPNRC
jgi:hypothetical protein